MSVTADELKNEKRKLLCHECGTVSFIKINKIPDHIKEIPCTQCGAHIPLLDRLTNIPLDPSAVGTSTAALSSVPGSFDSEALYTSPHVETEEGDDESGWLMSFSDVMTQLLAFFILLTAMSTMDRHKFDQAMQSIGSALGGRPQPAASNSSGGLSGMDATRDLLGYLRGKFKSEQGNMNQLRNTLEGIIEQQGMQNDIGLHIDNGGLVIIVQSAILFDEGSADIRVELKNTLREIGMLLAPLHNQIVIEGHTDNKPIATRQYPSNWELSMQRAINVVKFYTEEEAILNPARVIASGAAFYRPRYNVNSEDGYRNRRIEIHVQRENEDLFDKILHSH
ncbi:MAG: OmpA/MotB family protein [Methylococcaceae bacterium]